MKDNFFKWFKAISLEHFTITMGIVGQFASYIQAVKIFHLHSAYAVSFFATFIGLVSMSCWLMYGMRKHIKPLVICNIFGMVGALLVMGGIIYYH